MVKHCIKQVNKVMCKEKTKVLNLDLAHRSKTYSKVRQWIHFNMQPKPKLHIKVFTGVGKWYTQTTQTDI